jgi:hypothetical protein
MERTSGNASEMRKCVDTRNAWTPIYFQFHGATTVIRTGQLRIRKRAENIRLRPYLPGFGKPILRGSNNLSWSVPYSHLFQTVIQHCANYARGRDLADQVVY